MLPILEKTTDYALIVPYVTRIFPLVERKLEVWSAKAGTIPEPELRKQALASISKRFHCQAAALRPYTRHKALNCFISLSPYKQSVLPGQSV